MAQQTKSRARRATPSTAKRTAAKKAPAKKAPARTAPAKKAPAKKAPATAAVKKAPAKKAPVKKAPVTKAAVTAKGRVSRNETPNTPDRYESALARMKVDELRQMARAQNIPGLSTMRKNDLVKALLKVGTGGKKAAGRGAKKTTVTAKKTTAAAKKSTAAAKKSIGPGRRAAASSSRGRQGIRAGPSSARSLRYAQVIETTADRPERPGRSLVTTNHDVIRKWAEERNAIPATVEGTKQRNTIAVLRFDFPLGPSQSEGSRLRHVSWDEWFKAFDERGLNFIYQEQRTDGRQSNFFRLENPSREDA